MEKEKKTRVLSKETLSADRGNHKFYRKSSPFHGNHELHASQNVK
jgi:hypothetical protein